MTPSPIPPCPSPDASTQALLNHHALLVSLYTEASHQVGIATRYKRTRGRIRLVGRTTRVVPDSVRCKLSRREKKRADRLIVIAEQHLRSVVEALHLFHNHPNLPKECFCWGLYRGFGWFNPGLHLHFMVNPPTKQMLLLVGLMRVYASRGHYDPARPRRFKPRKGKIRRMHTLMLAHKQHHPHFACFFGEHRELVRQILYLEQHD